MVHGLNNPTDILTNRSPNDHQQYKLTGVCCLLVYLTEQNTLFLSQIRQSSASLSKSLRKIT